MENTQVVDVQLSIDSAFALKALVERVTLSAKDPNLKQAAACIREIVEKLDEAIAAAGTKGNAA